MVLDDLGAETVTDSFKADNIRISFLPRRISQSTLDASVMVSPCGYPRQTGGINMARGVAVETINTPRPEVVAVNRAMPLGSNSHLEAT